MTSRTLWNWPLPSSPAICRSRSAQRTEIQALRANINAAELPPKLSVAVALGVVERKRDRLEIEVAQAKLDVQMASRLAEPTQTNELQRSSSAKDSEIKALMAKLETITESG
jgi:hypothetical protein